MTGIEVIKMYHREDCDWLPMVSLADMIIPETNEYGERNLAWNAGLLEDKRPYFVELWASDCITMLTIYVCANGIEEKTAKEMCDWFQEIGYFKITDDFNAPEMKTFLDDKGNEFFSINICVGIEDTDPFIEGGSVFSLDIINEYNQRRKDGV